MPSNSSRDLAIEQVRESIKELALAMKEIEGELKATDEKQQAALVVLQTFVNSMALVLGDGEDVKKMKEDARKGALAHKIVWGALAAFGLGLVAAATAWILSGGFNGKKADVAPPRINPAMIGPPGPK